MPYLLEDLVVNRVDLVDEGANSAAFIQIYKRKERRDMDITEIIAKMKPEHAEVVQKALDDATEATAKAAEAIEARETAEAELTKANEARETAEAELAKANEARETAEAELAKAMEEAGDGSEDEDDAAKGGASFDEDEVIKSMPDGPAKALLLKERAKREAAEEVVRKAREEAEHTEAVAKAATLKSLPVPQETLVDIIKTADEGVIDLLTTVAAAVDGAVLGEVGKSGEGSKTSDAAWSEIEKEADKLVEADEAGSLTKQRAIATVIKTKPELYKRYLNEEV